jgi:hypothetical protein
LPTVLLASQCPAPVVEASYPLLATAENTTGAGVLVAKTLAAGATTLSSKWNRNADNLDLLATFGGGGFAIITGLTLSAGSGLTLNIAAGLAAIGGLVEKIASTLAVADNHPGTTDPTDRVWIWLSQAGAISSTLNTTPPATRCVLLGSCTTSGGVITAVDSSGVLYLKGGSLWRETADKGAPTDSPSATLSFFAKTWGGVFEWTGTAYKALYQPLSPNRKTLGSGESATIKDDEQVVVYGGVTVTGTGELVVEGTGELIVL